MERRTLMLDFKSFSNIKTIVAHIKKNSKNIPRHKMPQITLDNLEHFKTFLKENDIPFHICKGNPIDYKATQNQFNLEKVFKLYEDKKDMDGRPVIVSNDGYIVDGHHRWLTNYIRHLEQTNKTENTLNLLVIDRPLNEILHILNNSYEKTSYKTITEEHASSPKDSGRYS